MRREKLKQRTGSIHSKMNYKMKTILKSIRILFLFCFSLAIEAQNVPLGQEALVAYLDQELSGESAKRNLEYISRLHRMRGSVDYNKAIAFISEKLTDYNLENIEVLKIPVDGTIMYGTQKSRETWNVEFAELWEEVEQNREWIKKTKIADWQSMPLVVAQDSKSGEVSAELVDIGVGTKESDYSTKNVKGKLVLTSSQPGRIASLAVDQYGAAGIISYAQNQPSAWYGEDENLIRWGHFDYFANTQSFGFMVSLKQARSFQTRLNNGEKIKLHAKVIANTSPGNWEMLTAVIKGSDSKLSSEEILFTCHLDHPRPGANDNASGCVAILDIARTLKKLIDLGKIKRPKRTIRFLWSPEIEGTTALLNYKPEFALKTKFNIHMDMVGGGLETKGIYQVSRGPKSLPHFINDIGEAFGEFVNQASIAYTSGDAVHYPIVSKEGGKEPLNAIIGNFHMGSDFEVFTEGSFKIPSIYLHQYPDRYIHTNMDKAANIDPTVLKRSGFIGAASGYYLANLGSENIVEITNLMKQQMLNRAYKMLNFSNDLSTEEKENTKYYFWLQELEALNTIRPYANLTPVLEEDYVAYIKKLQSSIGSGKPVANSEKENSTVYIRNEKLKGGLLNFSYDYFGDHYDADNAQPRIFDFTGIRGKGSEYTYEALNLVNGKNNISDIRNILSAEFGPIPISFVSEYLKALQSIDVIQRLK